MANAGRIERKPEYDAADWEAVGKLKEYMEGLGFTFEENGLPVVYLNNPDCYICWDGSCASKVGFRKSIPGIVELLKNVKSLKDISIWNTVNDLRWLCKLGGIQSLYFWDFDHCQQLRLQIY